MANSWTNASANVSRARATLSRSIDPDARLRVPNGFLSRRRPVQEPLYERQERHKFLVVTLMEFRRADVELAMPVLPGIAFLDPLQRLPVPLHGRSGLDRHELHRPDDDLAELPHE